MVRRLPWWQQKRHALSRAEERSVIDAIYTAIREEGITLEQAREHARYKLATATTNPPSWVAGGFLPKNLPADLSDEVYEPLPESKGQPAQQTRPEQSGDATGKDTGADEFVPWCGDCDPPIATPRGPKCRPECPNHHPADA